MKISEHIELHNLLQQPARKIKVNPVAEIAEICQSCSGRCKTAANLVRCPSKEKWSK